jgi:hypothetical protein
MAMSLMQSVPRSKGATIFIHKHTSSESALEVAAHTDIKGDFGLELPEGGYDVLVTASGFAAGVKTVPVRPGKGRVCHLDVEGFRL